MTMTLAGNASTNSRGHRPLPSGAVSARTVEACGVSEYVEFSYSDGHTDKRRLLSWVGGQAGLLWANTLCGDYLPETIMDVIDATSGDSPGSYGHAAEHALADELGQALAGVFPSDDLACRFYQSGGEALAAAARLARHKTGRGEVASCGYHGAGAEWAHLPNTAGIPDSTIRLHRRFEWGNNSAVWALARECAAICVEVPALDDEAAIAAFLRECRQACDRGGAVFILDEVVTGFRLSLGGAAQRYGVKPDIACYGKAMSATGCVSAVVGLRELVEPIGGDVFYSTTFGGSPAPCAVAAATVKWLRENEWSTYEHIGAIGHILKDGYNELGIPCVGQFERSSFAFPDDKMWLAFCSEMIHRGIMVHRPNFPTMVHRISDTEITLAAAKDAIVAAREALASG